MSDDRPPIGMLPADMAKCAACGRWSYTAAQTTTGRCFGCANGHKEADVIAALTGDADDRRRMRAAIKAAEARIEAVRELCESCDPLGTVPVATVLAALTGEADDE